MGKTDSLWRLVMLAAIIVSVQPVSGYTSELHWLNFSWYPLLTGVILTLCILGFRLSGLLDVWFFTRTRPILPVDDVSMGVSSLPRLLLFFCVLSSFSVWLRE